jgi:hypothetical protein
MTSRSTLLSAALLFATSVETAAIAQPFPPEPADVRRAVGDWLVEHQAESDGGRIVRLTRAHSDHILEYYVSFWRGNAGPYSHASVERVGEGCGSETWQRDPAGGDLWRPESDVPAKAKIVRARLAEALAECGAGEDEVAAALAGFEPAFELASAWEEVGRLATLAEMKAIENYGREPETAGRDPVTPPN